MRGETKGIFALAFIFLMLVVPMVSAGVGISWNKESALVAENTKTCLTYNVYNPWPKDAYVKVELSADMQSIMTSSSSEVKNVPAYTYSNNSLPIKFCFKTPKVYSKDCLIGNSLICKQTCEEPMKVYQGEVEAVELSEAEFKAGGSGGSTTQMSVSAPIRVRVKCVPHGRNYSVVYGFVALVAAILLAVNYFRRRKDKKNVPVKKDDVKVQEKADSKSKKKSGSKGKKSKK